jgi:hypothetical protein
VEGLVVGESSDDLHSALAQAMTALREETGEVRRWTGRAAKGRERRTVQQGVLGGSGAQLYSMQETVRERGNVMHTNGQHPLIAMMSICY